jgi:hypothetical protein
MATDNNDTPSTDADSLQNKSKLWALVIVDSRLDDAALSCSAFRVYCHLCRRSDKEHVAWPGITSMAKTCRLKRNTVIAAIRELEEGHFLRVLRVGGKSSNYEILPVHCWTSPKEIPVSKTNRSKKDTTPVSKLDHTSIPNVPHQYPAISADQVPEPLEASEGIPLRYPLRSPKKESKKEARYARQEKQQCDRFASEAEVIRFIFSDTACREVECLTMDARWFWNKMEDQEWHRDVKKKRPVSSKERACRDFMKYDSRPSWKRFTYKNDEHREEWKRQCRQYQPEAPQELWKPDPKPIISCITGKPETY